VEARLPWPSAEQCGQPVPRRRPAPSGEGGGHGGEPTGRLRRSVWPARLGRSGTAVPAEHVQGICDGKGT